MQINLESQERKLNRKPLKSATEYPKKLSSYIVAFSLDDSKMKSSIEDLSLNLTENNKVSPTISSHTFTVKKSKQSINKADIKASNEMKNKFDKEIEDSQTISNIRISLNLNEVTSQPLVLFNAQKHTNQPKSNAENKRKKSKKYKRIIKVKNLYFNNKQSGNMTTKLKRYYKRTKNSNSPKQIQRGLYEDSALERVSRTSVLKKVLAKENLLEETEKSSVFEMNVSENSDGFFISPPLEGNSSFVSDSSQDTLTRQGSISSRNDDVTTTNSVIRIKDLKASPYKTDIINVAVAQINNTPNLNRNSYSVIVPQNNNTNYKGSLTSTETALSQTVILTSNYSFEGANKSYIGNISDGSFIDNNVSDQTLIPSNKLPVTSCDTFQTAKSNADFKRPSIQSNYDLRYSCDKKCQDVSSGMNDFHIYDKKDDIYRTQQLYNDIINMSIYPKATPGSSSVPDIPNNDNVIIAEDILKTQNQMKKMKHTRDEMYANFQNNFHANIFQKPLHVAIDNKNNLNLPNAAHFKTNIVDSSRTQRKCSEEARDCPTNFPELFDKFTIVLEIAVKRLEKTISEKIENELRKSFHEIEKLTRPIPHFGADISEGLSKDIQLDHVKISNATIESKPMTNTSLQCDIIQNEVIDKLMVDLTNDGLKSGVQSSSSNFTQKLMKPKLLKDYFEVLKAPLSFHYKEEVGKGDSVQISVEDAVDERIPPFDCVKTFFTLPVTFVRENMFVITSVPAFLFVLFVIYSYVLLILRMW